MSDSATLAAAGVETDPPRCADLKDLRTQEREPK